jgi:glycosyltransferase involved in cell wall biosynthesis
MALGVPAVSTAVMGTRDIVHAGKGALVVAEDVSEFAAAVVKVLNDRSLRARLAAEAQAYALTWSAPGTTLKLEAFYRDTIARSVRVSEGRSAGVRPQVR